MRRAARFVDVVSLAALVWVGAAALPVESLWFRPKTPIVLDAEPPIAPVIVFDRRILRDTRIQYQVTIRKIGSMETVCDPSSAPFTYRTTARLPEPIDLIWWANGSRRCWPLAPGRYVMETCWTVVQPFWGFVPPKTTCRQGPPFKVGGVE